jgi:hypothetical protein
MDKALTVTNSNGTLQNWGGRDEVREMADRMLAMHPEARKIGPDGMRAAAQIAILAGASPLPGMNELHVWQDKDNRTCYALGINYFRRKAQELGGVLWRIQPRQMNDREREQYGVVAGQLAAICSAVRAEDMIKYTGMGFAPNQVWDMLASTGTAVAQANEYAKRGRSPIWTVLKRAEIDLYRQLFPVMMQRAAEAAAGAAAPVIVEGEREAIAAGRDFGGVEQINGDLFGDDGPEPEPPTEEPAQGEPAGGAIDVEFETVEPEPPAWEPERQAEELEPEPALPGGPPAPVDWAAEADNAPDLDMWAYRVYQLHRDWFADAGAVKKAYRHIAGEWARANSWPAREAIGVYVNAVADGQSAGDAKRAARAKFHSLFARVEE